MASILIVEDSASMRTFIRATLEAAPELGEVDVAEAASGFDALRLLPRKVFELIITDINMPDINGLELARFVRTNANLDRVALLIVSSQASERDQSRAMALGADAFLAKPFTPEALRRAVVSCIGARSVKAPHGSSA